MRSRSSRPRASWSTWRCSAPGRTIQLEVDGGVKVDNIRAIAEAGADTFVAGSAIFDSPDYRGTIAEMRQELAKAARGIVKLQ